MVETRAPHRTRIAVGASLLLLAMSAAATLSDVAPHLLHRASNAATGAAAWLASTVGLESLSQNPLPLNTNEFAHLVGWMAVTMALGVMLPRIPLAAVAVGTFSISALLEPLQAVLSSTRTFSYADITTNATGVLVGVCMLTVWRVSIALKRGEPAFANL